VLASTIYGATAVATGVQLWWSMSWAVWGAPINPLEYFGLLGSVVLLVATVSGLRRHCHVQRMALCGLLLLWPFYVLLMYATWRNPSGSFTLKAAIRSSVPSCDASGRFDMCLDTVLCVPAHPAFVGSVIGEIVRMRTVAYLVRCV
jgi:hypothetical protein